MGAYLERQTEQSVRNMRWGRFSTVGRSGCGAVAAYNVAVALGKNPDFKALVWAMERRRQPSCGGLLGMIVLRLQRWLQRRFGRAELCVLGTDRWEARTRFCRAAVIFYKNRGIFRGNHFIAGTRTDAGFVFHNAVLLPPTRAFDMQEAVDRRKQAGHTPLMLIIL